MIKKKCVKCDLELARSSFHRDKNREDNLYPYCKDCRRALTASVKQPPKEYRNCSFCNILFNLRGTQVRENVTGHFFCTDYHKKQYLQKHRNHSHYKGYRKYILERDGNRCFLCRHTEGLHVHHIITRGAGGKNDYKNLITVCSNCHREKAHGADSKMYRKLFLSFTDSLTVPTYWGEIMQKSSEDTAKIKLNIRKYAKSKYNKIKNSSQYKEYQIKRKIYWEKREEKYKKVHGISYDEYLRKFGPQSKKHYANSLQFS